MSKNNNKRCKNKRNNGGPKAGWIYRVVFMTFGLSVFFSLISETLVEKVNLIVSFFILSGIVLIGIIFDIIGVAVTSASETPFHAMAADKVPGAKEAVKLIRNADVVSNFCNDVVGDISGIVSGAAGASIVVKIISGGSELKEILLSTLIAGLISAMTVGGKAFGKNIAIKNSKEIVSRVAYILFLLKERFGIELFPGKTGRK
ncbi:hypothetical protein [Thermosediminibacter litoriperuensis]|nr:hypothetical protein [Thermosediminibacter litoriperuensis]